MPFPVWQYNRLFMNDNDDIEQATVLTPKFDEKGLITCVVTDQESGQILMLAHMNATALERTLEEKIVYFYSRSRKTLWKKGETSGNILELVTAYIDCDQDALWVVARPAGPSCHTGETSCFYRKIDGQIAGSDGAYRLTRI